MGRKQRGDKSHRSSDSEARPGEPSSSVSGATKHLKLTSEDISRAGLDDYQATWQTLVEHVNEVYAQEILNKRLERIPSSLDSGAEKLSSLLAEANSVIGSTLVDFRRERNRNSFIHRLPIELLCRIFQFASQYTAPALVRAFQIDRESLPHTLLAISHICSHWRTVSLDYRQLWTTLHVERMSEGMVSLFRERCGEHLLNLSFVHAHSKDVTAAQPHEDRFTTIWATSTDRVRSLRYRPLHATSFATVFADASRSTLEHLEELELSNVRTMVTTALPNLRTLILSSAAISRATASSLTQLVHFSCHQRGFEAITMPFETILAILSGSPHLQSLELTSRRCFTHLPTIFSEAAQMPLVHRGLRTILLNLSTEAVNLFLRCVAPSDLTQLTIVLESAKDVISEAISSVPDCVPCLCPSWTQKSSTEVKIDFRTCKLKIWHTCWASEDSQRASRVFVNLNTTPTYEAEKSKINAIDALSRVAGELVPRFFGHQPKVVPVETAAASEEQPAQIGPEQSTPQRYGGFYVVRLLNVGDPAELQGFASVMAPLNIARLKISDTTVSTGTITSLCTGDQLLRGLVGRIVMFSQCRLQGLCSTQDVSAAVEPLVSAGALVIFNHCKVSTPESDGSEVEFDWRSRDHRMTMEEAGST